MKTPPLNRRDRPFRAAGESPFDGLAAAYDESFSQSVLGRLLRDAVYSEVRGVFACGERILDLGCGTGEDALWLSSLGVSVCGIDASHQMVERARAKAAGRDASGPEDMLAGENIRDLGSANDHFGGNRHAGHITLHVADLNRVPLPEGPFDGAFSNFGVVNCLTDRPSFAVRLHRVLRPGGRAVFVVMGRHVPWEWLWYLFRGRPGIAFRRLSGNAEFNGISITYPTSSQLTEEFEPHFHPVRTAGIGMLLPPTFAAELIERHPALGCGLASAESRIRHWQLAASLSDHYLIEMVRS